MQNYDDDDDDDNDGNEERYVSVECDACVRNKVLFSISANFGSVAFWSESNMECDVADGNILIPQAISPLTHAQSDVFALYNVITCGVGGVCITLKIRFLVFMTSTHRGIRMNSGGSVWPNLTGTGTHTHWPECRHSPRLRRLDGPTYIIKLNDVLNILLIELSCGRTHARRPSITFNYNNVWHKLHQ